MPRLERKKIENCFANSMTFEYRLGIPNEELFEKLAAYGTVTRKEFRRPVLLFVSSEGIQAKGVVGTLYVRVGYPDDNLAAIEPFELVLQSLASTPRKES